MISVIPAITDNIVVDEDDEVPRNLIPTPIQHQSSQNTKSDLLPNPNFESLQQSTANQTCSETTLRNQSLNLDRGYPDNKYIENELDSSGERDTSRSPTSGSNFEAATCRSSFSVAHNPNYIKPDRECVHRGYQPYQYGGTNRNDFVEATLKEKDEEISNLSSLLYSQNLELSQLRLDFKSMTNEVNTNNKENYQLKSDLAQKCTATSSLQLQTQNLEQAYRATELEKERISSHYRKMLDERNEKDYLLQQSSSEQKELYIANTQLQRQIEMIQTHVRDLEQVSNMKQYDCAVYEQQIETLKSEYDSLKRKQEAANNANHQLRYDITSARQNVNDMTCYIQELQCKLAQTESCVNLKQDTVLAVDSEREALKRLLGQERDRGKDLEKLLEQSRCRSVSAEKEIERLIKENAQLETLLNEKKVTEKNNCEANNKDKNDTIGSSYNTKTEPVQKNNTLGDNSSSLSSYLTPDLIITHANT